MQDEMTSDAHSSVCHYLRGREILLTGVTGFVGKVVLEKIMRAIPDVTAVHLIVRANDQYPRASTRFRQEVLSSSVFDHLKLEQPARFDRFVEQRIVCHDGDITMPRLGLGRSEFEALARRVDGVIHGAASVDFRGALDRSLAANTLCLEHLVEFTETAGNVPLVQLSTCFVNGFHRGEIAEEVRGPAGRRLRRHRDGYFEVDPLIRVLLDKIEDLRSRYYGEKLTERLVELGQREAQSAGWNDVYTFSKWLGEQYLLQRMRGRSLTIVRPSIVESTLREPVPGWIEGIKVADAVILAYARQKVLFFPARREGILDIIPADLVANAVLLSLAEQMKSPGRQRIYQVCSGSSNPITVGEAIDEVVAEGQENHRAYPRLFPQEPTLPFRAVNRRVFNALTRGTRLPLAVVDKSLEWLGRPAAEAAVDKLEETLKLAQLFGFYSCPQYRFRNDRLLDLAARMGSHDRTLFPVDARAVDWPKYLRRIHLPGLDHYALSERRMFRLSSRSGHHVA